jgi:hypothetical protein
LTTHGPAPRRPKAGPALSESGEPRSAGAWGGVIRLVNSRTTRWLWAAGEVPPVIFSLLNTAGMASTPSFINRIFALDTPLPWGGTPGGSLPSKAMSECLASR